MKFQAIVLASFLVMPYALADDQGGLKQDAAPPPPHAIEDGYRGTDDAKKMTVDSIGQRNSYVKTWGCGGFLNETNIYSRGKSLCF
ncbi:stress response protein [Escherichia coli]|nr:hypothetical protein [Escherichia coli]CUA53434.1 stress response protein [Escherichia coli]